MESGPHIRLILARATKAIEKVAEVLTVKELTQVVKLLKKIGRHAQSLDIE